jgi:hypothetical protein
LTNPEPPKVAVETGWLTTAGIRQTEESIAVNAMRRSDGEKTMWERDTFRWHIDDDHVAIV